MDEVLKRLSEARPGEAAGLAPAWAPDALAADCGLSAEELSGRLEALRAEGYRIATEGGKARLEPPPDSLLPGYVRLELRTRRMGRGELLYAPSVGSTNAVLKEEGLARALPDGSVALCDRQTQGRGRMQRVWEDPAAGLNLPHSLLLRPKLPPEQTPLYTLAAAVAAARAIEDMGFTPRIKWPNDVVLQGRKCVGILCERVVSGPESFLVVGVGFNVNQPSFPGELQQKATSLLIEGGRPVDRRALLCAYLLRMEQAAGQLERDGLPGLLPDYTARSVTLGGRVEVLGATTRFVGVAEALDDTGALLVRDDADGALRRVLSADVSVRGVMGYV